MAKKQAHRSGLWLFKEEPSCYTFDQLMQDGETVWSGVTNNLARQNLRTVKKGDRVLFYQTGKIRAIVGEMKVTSDPQTDPDSDDPKSVVVSVKPGKRWQRPVSLTEIKAVPELAEWDLVRLSRLSIVPVTRIQWNMVEEIRDQAD